MESFWCLWSNLYPHCCMSLHLVYGYVFIIHQKGRSQIYWLYIHVFAHVVLLNWTIVKFWCLNLYLGFKLVMVFFHKLRVSLLVRRLFRPGCMCIKELFTISHPHQLLLENFLNWNPMSYNKHDPVSNAFMKVNYFYSIIY